MCKLLLTISLFVLASFHKTKINYSIELYILPNSKSIVKNGLATEFEINNIDLPTLPFIRDDDIEYYDTSHDKIFISQDAAKRISELKPKLNVGIPFVLTVDRQPILTGYFWNTVSSFGCASYVLFNSNDTSQNLLRGLPEYSYVDSIIEKRRNYFFLQALERTGRIK
jgi:hypothetical protein